MNERRPQLGAAGISLISLGIMVLITAVPAMALWTLRDNLPAEVATHWGVDGQPDGWMSLPAALLMTLVLSVALPGTMLALGAALRAATSMGALSVGTTGFIAALSYGSMWFQRDGGETHIGRLILGATGTAIALGVLSYLILRGMARPEAVGQGPIGSRQSALHVEKGTLLTWQGNLRVSRGVVTFAITITTATLILAVVLFRLADPWIAATMLVLVVVVVLAFSTLAGKVIIDNDGVRVTVFGIRILRVELPDIVDVGTLNVEPLGEYGGWGYRLALDGQSQGMVTSRGEGFVVRRASQRALVLTVDDSRNAARVLTTLIQQREG